MKMKGMAHG
jgi:hypothetical protein